MAEVLSKYPGLIPSLALLIHLADHPANGSVSHDALLKACAWGEYLESHAKRIYSAQIHPDLIGAVQLGKKIKAGALPQRFTSRDVYRSHWSRLNNVNQAEAAIAVLVDHHWLNAEPESSGPSGGRPHTWYRVNPKVRED